MQNIGIRIKEVREELRLNQESFAKELGVAITTLSNWERGAAAPPANKLTSMRNKFGVDLNWLITGEGAMKVEIPVPRIDLDLLRRVIEKVDVAGKELSAKKRAGMAALLYDHAAKSGGTISEDVIRGYLALAS